MATDPEKVILQELDEQMDLLIDRIFELSQQNLVDDGNVDTGTMLKTANVNRQFLEKEITYPTPYSEVINFGRHPGTMPPSDALVNWVKRKLQIRDPKRAKSVAFAIAKALKERGFEGTHFLDRAVDEAQAEIKLKRVMVS